MLDSEVCDELAQQKLSHVELCASLNFLQFFIVSWQRDLHCLQFFGQFDQSWYGFLKSDPLELLLIRGQYFKEHFKKLIGF